MSPRAARLTLWATFLATLPLPYFMVEIGWMPVVWLATLAGLVSASALLDGFSGTWLIALLFIAQTLGYAGLLYVTAILLVRLSRWLPEKGRGASVAVLVALLWGVAVTQRIFWTDLVNVDPRMSLLELF